MVVPYHTVARYHIAQKVVPKLDASRRGKKKADVSSRKESKARTVVGGVEGRGELALRPRIRVTTAKGEIKDGRG